MIYKTCSICHQNEPNRKYTMKEKVELICYDLDGIPGYLTKKNKVYMCPACHDKFITFIKNNNTDKFIESIRGGR